jgi:hypothetical protein
MTNPLTGHTPATPEQAAQWALEDDSPVFEHYEQEEPDYV